MRLHFLRGSVSAAAVSLLLTSCSLLNRNASAPATGGDATLVTSNGKQRELRQLGRLMEGDYNSTQQAANDKEYFDIRLHIKRVWKEIPEDKGIYLYVEQATASAQQRPYRQRVYHLRSREDGKLESVVYELVNPIRFTGQWKVDKPLAMLTPDSLVSRPGCNVIMRKAGRREYRGATNGQDCLSSLRGAKYAQTDVTITPNQLISWDRGFDEKGEQVWGAKFGGYQFQKEKSAGATASAEPAVKK